MFPIPVEDLLRGALIFVRVGGILFALPIFGDQPTPVRVRILLSVAVAFGIAPIVPATWLHQLPTDVLSLVTHIVRELVIGLAVGFVARIAFEGILFAASIVGYQMGFGTASLFMPDAGEQMSGFSAFHRIIVLMIFLALNLHHVFFKGILETFEMIPAGGAVLHSGLAHLLIQLTSQIFYIGLQLAAPVLVALMFTMAALGLVARTVPQFQVFVMSFPISFFVGLLVYIATIPMFPGWLESHFGTAGENLLATVRGLKP